MESEKASPLPEGRADGRALDHAYVESPYPYCHQCGNHRNAHPAPAVPVGVQPEPAERLGCCIYHDALNACAGDDICCDACPAIVPAPLKCETPCRDEGCAAWGCGWAAAAAEDLPAAPAVPVVHPEPASESSDSVAELAADTTRSGDRAAEVQVEMNAWVAASEAWITAGARGAEALREALWAARPIFVAAAVAAVRADCDRLAGQVAAIRALAEKADATAARLRKRTRRGTQSARGFILTDDIRTALEEK